MWYRWRKKASVLIVSSILTVMLAACGGESGSGTATIPGGGGLTPTAGQNMTDGSPTAGGTADASPTAGGAMTTPGGGMSLPAGCSNVQLQYWNPFTGPDGPFMQTIVDNFNTANAGQVNVKMTTIQAIGGEYDTQLDTAQASNTLPDIAIINEDAVATRAFRNTLRPMDDIVNSMGITSADFPQVAWNAGQVAGKTYGVPLSFVVMTMYYNEDLLKAAGLTGPPTNAEEFDRAAAAMTKDGNNGFMLTTAFPVQQIFQQLLHQYGGTEFSEDGSRATWNSEAGVKALTWMRDANAKYGQPNLEVDAELNAFKAGTVGMVWNGIWQIPNMTGESVSFTGKVAVPPTIGQQAATWAGGPLLTLPAQQNADECRNAAAGMFVKYVLDNSLEWAKAGNIPASNKVRNSAEFKALPHAVLAPAAENPVFPPAIPGIGAAFTPLGESVGAVIAGTETDIKKALDAAAQRADAILAENKQNFGDAPKSP
jgi:multiple sugar transport system substrate-binding protein